MPYYVYAVRPFAQLERLGEYAAFRDASAMVKTLRAERARNAGDEGSGGGGAREHIRVMFAETALAAEDLLLQTREPPPPGDE